MLYAIRNTQYAIRNMPIRVIFVVAEMMTNAGFFPELLSMYIKRVILLLFGYFGNL